MKIHLIAPSRIEPLGFKGKASLAPPLNLAILGGLSPADAEVSLTDENATPIDWEQPADLVGITSTTLTAVRAYQIADEFRARGVQVVLGGMHPTALPQEALSHADAVVVGEAEEVWSQVVADARVRRLRPLYRAERFPSLAGLPLPRRDLFRREAYFIPDTLYTTRGCPYGCTFCAVTTFFGGTYRQRPSEDVLAEYEAMGKPRLVAFLDDNVAAHPGRAKRLFRALTPYKMNWLGQADLTIAHDEELLRVLAESGCKALLLGIESLSPTNLGAVGKRTNQVQKYEEAIRRIHAHGIAIFGAFLVGLDDDDAGVFERTLRFAERVRLEGAQFNIPTPYPGTPLYRAVEGEGRILSRNWADYGSDKVVIAPRQMSVAQLQEGHAWLWHEFYSLRSAWRRIGLLHADALMIWVLNVVYRDDWLSHSLLGPLLALAERIYQIKPTAAPTPVAHEA